MSRRIERDGDSFVAFNRLGRALGTFLTEREAIAAVDPRERQHQRERYAAEYAAYEARQPELIKKEEIERGRG
jgi:hypothetical protein